MNAERGRATSGVVILAAGGSTRLGQPKQLLRYGGITLLEHDCRVALLAAPRVYVVLGAGETELRPFVPSGVRIVSNPHWADGLSSSIRAGIEALPAEVQVAVLMLVDQPLVTADHLLGLLGSVSRESPVSASRYPDGSVGVPAAFHRTVYPELMALRGDAGAKAVIMARPGLPTVKFPDPLDIDTPDDVTRLDRIEPR